MKKLLLLLSCLFSISPAFSVITEIYDVKQKKVLTKIDFIKELPKMGHIILGEFHNTPSIQNAQAEIIKAKMAREKSPNNFTIFWEFLNHTDRLKTSLTVSSLKQNSITPEQALLELTTKNNLTYLPIFNLLPSSNGSFLGINIPRSVKQKVIKEGIDSIDQTLVPVHHYIGTDLYFDRFKLAMGGHAPSETVTKYFEAQCLTDSVMAEQIFLNENLASLNFTIVGAFHTDYFDGTTIRLQALTSLPLKTIKLINTKQTNSAEVEKLKEGHPKFGQISDYLISTN